MNAFPLIEIEGGPDERGRQYGRAAGDHIARSLAFYREEFARRGVDWQEACLICDNVRKEIAAYDPGSEREIVAIAAGAEQPVESVLMINARTEVLNARRYENSPAIPAECSGIVALPEITQSATVLHGQNWDWLDAVAASTVVLRIKEEDGTEILTLAEAGQLARSGMNKAGLALTANGLHTDAEGRTAGVCSPVIRRNLLRRRTLGEAIGVVMKAPRNYSHNFMISHASGLAIDLETTPRNVFWIKPEDGLLVHTNHFKNTAALASTADDGVRASPDSLVREMLIEQRLAHRSRPVDMDMVINAFMDRTDEPYGVLQPPSANKSGVLESTVATIVMEPAAGRMRVCRTPYQGRDFHEYSFT
ncbi:C45 family peptidase [uncultured Nitratireductor sp.]|uniref:C45 family autoproteolytic acyltransferase/hydolase n=1 Tax=uncultured Nitratireductor sp. TaxID=520953 RepID=UPI0025D58755|nr:C45 family peptidase [uncultured Nitratireductor sp.]